MKRVPIIPLFLLASVTGPLAGAAATRNAGGWEGPPAGPGGDSTFQAQLPPLILNEVLFDTGGTDGSALGGEWVELFSTRSVELGGWTLEDHQGVVLGTLPAMTLPRNGVVAVFLRSDLPHGFDTDPTDRQASIALALPPGDHLDNDAGGVRLVGPAGTLTDAVYWGHGSAPAGASGAGWIPGTFFDLAYGSGRPMVEGDSLGRPANPLADITGTVSDWERNGGRNAAGPTPAARNGVELTGMTGLKIYAQTGVNQVINSFGSTVQPGWFSIVSSKIEDSVYSYQPDLYTVTSQHTFLVKVHGVPTELAGELTASFARDETPGSVHYSLSVSGLLESVAGYSFQLEHEETWSGFHTDAVSCTASTETIYSDSVGAYPFDVEGTVTTSWVDDGVQRTIHDRICSDYGGAGPKFSSSELVEVRLADGVRSTSFYMMRDRPIGPPPLGQAGSQALLGTETFLIDTSATGNDAGEVTSGTVTRFERYEDDTLVLTLADDAAGAFDFRLTHGQPGQYPQSQRYRIDLPLSSSGSPLPLSGEVTGTAWLSQGKLMSSATSILSLAGSVIETQEWFVDPVVQDCPHCPNQGIIHLHACSICDPLPPPEPEPPAPEPPPAKEKSLKGFSEASATCTAAGAGLGAGLGGTVGAITGAISGAAAGGVGAVAGAIAGAKTGGLGGGAVGGAAGALVCAGAYLLGWWE